jgi:hypothetical protein
VAENVPPMGAHAVVLRSITRFTVVAVHAVPPRGVLTPRASSAAAIARKDVAPACRMLSIVSITSLAVWSASARLWV